MKNINTVVSNQDVQLELIQKEILKVDNVSINLVSEFIIKRFMERVA